VACGELLPDAPLPAASQAPFLRLEGSGGRSVTGLERKLTYRVGVLSAPVVVELGGLQSVALVRRAFLEALVLVLVALVLTLVAPSLRSVAAGLAGLGVLGAGLWRRYTLGLRTLEGGSLQWSLGLVWLGSRRTHELEKAWSSAAQALASRGVTVQDSSAGSPGSGA
jgi:hypothetical protein